MAAPEEPSSALLPNHWNIMDAANRSRLRRGIFFLGWFGYLYLCGVGHAANDVSDRPIGIRCLTDDTERSLHTGDNVVGCDVHRLAFRLTSVMTRRMG
jgi:hypothetical protein